MAALSIRPTNSGANVTVNGKPHSAGDLFEVGTRVQVVVRGSGLRTYRRTHTIRAGGLALTPSLLAVGRGTLKLASDPWAEVIVDGKPLGRQTPIYDLRLSSGPHRITLVNNLEQLRMEFTVVIRANKSTSRAANLRTKKVQ